MPVVLYDDGKARNKNDLTLQTDDGALNWA